MPSRQPGFCQAGNQKVTYRHLSCAEYSFFKKIPSGTPEKSTQKSIQKNTTRPYKRRTILANIELTIYTHSAIFTCAKIITREGDRTCLPFTLWASFLFFLEKKSYSTSFNITNLNLLGNGFLYGEA